MAVLGDMGELGEKAALLHREVGLFAGTCAVDVLYCIGEFGKSIAEGAEESAAENGRAMTIRWFSESREYLNGISGFIQKDDTVLVKASRFMGLEKIVSELRAL